jgi:hypothetical protein
VTIILGGDSPNKTFSPKRTWCQKPVLFPQDENYFASRRDVGCDRMTTPLGTLGLSFVVFFVFSFIAKYFIFIFYFYVYFIYFIFIYLFFVFYFIFVVVVGVYQVFVLFIYLLFIIIYYVFFFFFLLL